MRRFIIEALPIEYSPAALVFNLRHVLLCGFDILKSSFRPCSTLKNMDRTGADEAGLP